MPGLTASLLEDFGIRLLTYDLPGFGESDPHPKRNLESSARDMLFLANSVGIRDRFWVVGYSSGSMHAWAALRYIPDKIAGINLPFFISIQNLFGDQLGLARLRNMSLYEFTRPIFSKFIKVI